MFTGLPADTVWQWVALTRQELLGVRYVDWEYWLEVSGGTRRPVDAIPRIGHSPNCQNPDSCRDCRRAAATRADPGGPPRRP